MLFDHECLVWKTLDMVEEHQAYYNLVNGAVMKIEVLVPRGDEIFVNASLDVKNQVLHLEAY